VLSHAIATGCHLNSHANSCLYLAYSTFSFALFMAQFPETHFSNLPTLLTDD